jgi:lysyl-tRNA synthetase class 1
MDWADELAARVSGPQVVNDSKTPSGTVHVGSLRGPVILDVIVRALRAASLPTTFLYGIDDLDPMDAQSQLTADAIEREMGRPLAAIPDQAGDGHASYARHHAEAFIDTFAGLGIHPDRYYWMSEHYAAGDLDPYIRLALDRAATVRDIYRRVAGVQHPDSWHPVSVICETCGKIGTTIVTEWDGARVHYECRPDLVTWARGCGNSGWTSPFGGRAKLPWNLEWAAQWSLFGVTIEPCGKDLATAGGSRDRADAIAREVFEREPPIRVDYEFLLIGGRKMSTSKGVGAAAHRIVEVLPPDQLRFLMVRPSPNHAINFKPEGTDAVPRVFDEFDLFAAATSGREVDVDLPPGYSDTFRYSLARADADVNEEARAFRIAFLRAAMFVQGREEPHKRAELEKGVPLTPRETEILDERLAAAQVWLAEYAPEQDRFVVWDELPPIARDDLGADQRQFLAELASALKSGGSWVTREPDNAFRRGGDAWQAVIFETAKRVELPPRRAFEALYLAFLGKTNGPRAGWLLAGLKQPGFIETRLREAAMLADGPAVKANVARE